jgi:hypothetical protein
MLPRASWSALPWRCRRAGAVRSTPPPAPRSRQGRGRAPTQRSHARAGVAGTPPCDSVARGSGGSGASPPTPLHSPRTDALHPPAQRSPKTVLFKAERCFPQLRQLRRRQSAVAGPPPPRWRHRLASLAAEATALPCLTRCSSCAPTQRAASRVDTRAQPRGHARRCRAAGAHRARWRTSACSSSRSPSLRRAARLPRPGRGRRARGVRRQFGATISG